MVFSRILQMVRDKGGGCTRNRAGVDYKKHRKILIKAKCSNIVNIFLRNMSNKGIFCAIFYSQKGVFGAKNTIFALRLHIYSVG